MRGVYIALLVLVLVVVMVLVLPRKNKEKELLNIQKEHFNGDMEKMKARYDGKVYNIQKHLPDQHIATELLAKLNNKMLSFIKNLKNKYPDDAGVKRLSKRYRPSNLAEGTPLNDDNETSYSTNKGEELVFCLRNKRKPGVFVDFNTLVFVAIHELAHLMNNKWGHGKSFNKSFKFLLKEAMSNGLYSYQDYYLSPVVYCGLEIKSTPL